MERKADSGAIALTALAFLFLPAVLLVAAGRTWRGRRTLARLRRGADDLGAVRRVRIDGTTLRIDGSTRGASSVTLPLTDVVRAYVVELEGDRGFADANSVTHLVVLTRRLGAPCVFTTRAPGDDAARDALWAALREAGPLDEGSSVPGALTGPRTALAAGLALGLWASLAAALWIALRGS